MFQPNGAHSSGLPLRRTTVVHMLMLILCVKLMLYDHYYSVKVLSAGKTPRGIIESARKGENTPHLVVRENANTNPR